MTKGFDFGGVQRDNQLDLGVVQRRPLRGQDSADRGQIDQFPVPVARR
jgi:hypothetical protein